jgi:hypothetical protein
MTKQKKFPAKKHEYRKGKNRDFFKVAAALANPDFVNLPSPHKESIRQALSDSEQKK